MAAARCVWRRRLMGRRYRIACLCGWTVLRSRPVDVLFCIRTRGLEFTVSGKAISASYGPGGAWFEAGPEPVFAQADMEQPSRFIRAMVLPRALMGASSIHYVNEADRAKPKSQTYRVWAEAPIELP